MKGVGCSGLQGGIQRRGRSAVAMGDAMAGPGNGHFPRFPLIPIPKSQMKKSRMSAIALAAVVLSTSAAKAAVTLSNIELTPTSLKFTVSGTLPPTAPAGSAGFLVLVNPEVNESPGYTVGSFDSASTQNFTGAQGGGLLNIYTGNPSAGDYTLIYFSPGLVAGSELSGTFTAEWSSIALDPTAVTHLDLYWGMGSTMDGGTYLGTMELGTVPEPSFVLMLPGGAALGWLRRKR